MNTTEYPKAPAASSPAPIKGAKRRLGGKFLVISIVVHLLFGLGAAYYVVQTITAKRKLTFHGGPPSPNPSQRAIEHKVQMAKKQNSMSAPPPVKRIVTTGMAKVALPDMPSMPTSNPVAASKAVGAGGVGVGFGPSVGGASAMAGGGSSIPFFGLKMQARRIAFLLDYSGSMQGAFRSQMEKELEHCLQGLPQGSQILIIPWAGPAWLVNQKASEIASKWKMIDGYDNFTIRSGEKLDTPQWITISPESIKETMKALKAQQALPGGTDWRSPFRYVMEATPPPDVIFFMTDGQIPEKNALRALNAIDQAVKKNNLHVPQVNCLWIYNTSPENRPDTLKKLAKRYKGEFVEVGKP